MTDNEIVKRLQFLLKMGDAPIGKGFGVLIDKQDIHKTLKLINRQQATLTAINDLIVENTYPGFDKEGKPVCIWNTDGYKKIENLLKAGDSDA